MKNIHSKNGSAHLQTIVLTFVQLDKLDACLQLIESLLLPNIGNHKDM